MFDFDAYQMVFNSGDDEGALEFWADDLRVTMPVGPGQIGVAAANKDQFRRFLAAAHVGIREVMRLQSMVQQGDLVMAEIDMDFIATQDRPDFDFGSLAAGEFVTVKMFGIYTVRDGLLWRLKMAFWPPNQGVTYPPEHHAGVAPPPFASITRASR